MSAGASPRPGAVHVVVPAGVDDPAHPSGGNRYDRRVCDALASLGWSVVEHAAPGGWPGPTGDERARLAATLAAIPAGTPVLLDGLIASAAPSELAAEASRLSLVALVHMPLGTGSSDREPGDRALAAGARRAEAAALGACAAVVATSEWTRRGLLDRHPLRPAAVHVAPPGADAAPPAAATAAGAELLCVAVVAPHKGHDLLVAALGGLADLDWRCTCVGALDRDPAFVGALRRRAADAGVGDRIRFVGPRTGTDLDAAYATADLLVHASRSESYGMVLTEALARGVPVVASAVGGVQEAIGHDRSGDPGGGDPAPELPGVLVPAGDADALRVALRDWLTDPGLRRRWRAAAARRRATLTDWTVTADRIARVLAGVPA